MNSIPRRLLGVLIILRALLPLLLLLAAILIARQITVEIRAAIREPVDRINHNVQLMQAKIVTAEQGFQHVGQAVTAVTGSVNQVAAQVGNIPTSIPINLDTISVPDGFRTVRMRIAGVGFDLPTGLTYADINLDEVLPVPGLFQVKAFFQNTFGFFGQVSQIITEVVGLSSITREISEILQASKEVVDSVGGTLQRWGTAAVIVLVLAMLLLLISYFEYLIRNFSRGWALLRGENPVG